MESTGLHADEEGPWRLGLESRWGRHLGYNNVLQMMNLLQQYDRLKLKGACVIYFIAFTEAFHAVRLTRGVSQSWPPPWDGRRVSWGDITTSIQVMESFTDHLHIDLPSTFQCSLKNAMAGLVTTISVLGASTPLPAWAATDIAMDTPPPQIEEVKYDDFLTQMNKGNVEKVCCSRNKESPLIRPSLCR